MLDRAPALARPVPVASATCCLTHFRLGCPDHRARWASTFTDASTEFEPFSRALAQRER